VVSVVLVVVLLKPQIKSPAQTSQSARGFSRKGEF
jgi:hypothetical protein